MAIAACGSSPQSPLAPSAPAPIAPAVPPGYHTLSGTVFEAVDGTFRPVRGARTVFLWVEQRTERGRTGSVQRVAAEANGTYRTSVPDSHVSVQAWGQNETQPCLTAADVQSDTTLDVHVVPQVEAASAAVRQLQSEGPIVSGQVYEMTAAGARPVPGAEILVDISLDVYYAFTKADELGRFRLCRINSPIRIEVGLRGYQWEWRYVPGGTNLDLDIELKRE